ncbi:tRNA lysidine(34) synthetase TilS [Phaeovibrio sulfidiphilus]|uniref:tRNA(Ile)-lysidine synthase n=1 Tax=Phaeovibrio sulfidiphilus TaxID=1220600 RepID=A0A8J6YWS6_9PROT|nr:tRNA lysidine(34) synthetase TilS [Phaeovibrio sulfidiphilus]MBE1236113.1 tRNA lysidine(34) synthetase TilS [Phaeovibrio sulfidiphilus]
MPERAFFRRRLAGLGIPAGPRTILGLGLSGGPDSTALLALACDWAKDCDARVVALCLDHRLRAGSTAEARAAAALARELGATARILTWEGDRPGSAIQEQARDRRLEALTSACKDDGALFLLLAHHADDQAETVRMRRERSTSAHSLSGMPMVVFRRDVAVVRPLLDVPKADLVALCQRRGLPFARDPSNLNPAFERVRIRAQLGAGKSAGEDAGETGALCDEARRAAAARAREARAVADCLARCTLEAGEDRLRLDADALAAAPRPVALEALRHVARSLSGSPYLPRPKPLYETLPDPGSGRLTWGGCLWTRSRAPNPAPPAGPRSGLPPASPPAPDPVSALLPASAPGAAPAARPPALSDPGHPGETEPPGHAPATGTHGPERPRRRVLSVCRAATGALTRRVVSLPEGRPVLWDGRWELTAVEPGLGVRALGKAPLPGATPADTAVSTTAKPGPGFPVTVRLAPPDTAADRTAPGMSGTNTLTSPPKAPRPGQTSAGTVRARYRPPFPVLEEGIRLEADGQEPYIHS